MLLRGCVLICVVWGSSALAAYLGVGGLSGVSFDAFGAGRGLGARRVGGLGLCLMGDRGCVGAWECIGPLLSLTWHLGCTVRSHVLSMGWGLGGGGSLSKGCGCCCSRCVGGGEVPTTSVGKVLLLGGGGWT